jgi:uncharacterized protein (TIGR03067 family)
VPVGITVRRLNARQFASFGQTHNPFLAPLSSAGTRSKLTVASLFDRNRLPKWLNIFLKEFSMLLKPFVVLTLLLSFSLAARSGDARDSDTIQGTWLPSTAELGGKIFPDEVRKTIKLVVNEDKYTVTVGQAVDQGTLKLNPAAKPKELDITGTDGPNKGRTILAIYERDSDTLRICYDLSGKSRPTEFKSKEGTQLFLVTYKQEKP